MVDKTTMMTSNSLSTGKDMAEVRADVKLMTDKSLNKALGLHCIILEIRFTTYQKSKYNAT